jgi:hypothetical protein
MPVRPRFALGYTVIKPKALKMLTPEEVIAALGSHVVGEWGEVGQSVFEANEEAVENDEPVVSAYRSPSADTRFYVMTSADRSVTTVFLPDEVQL